MTTLYGINNCDTIKKTRSLLAELGVDYEFHDYKKLGCDEALVRTFLKHFDFKSLVNTRGTTWRKLPDAVKQDLNEASAIKIMSENNSIIKRPIIESQGEWLLGFDKQQIQDLAQD
ncbi:MAG: ArsC family reductase [SAR86 cluster bacterium]|uniref:ArsC family reductase n=1 Tax=SAR86 cluster bacterium TaxID=2030880 RepID=A0A2A4X010_9GAMM|nr:MAG: ArsC family reductase [SAR86 cluster bacterium]